MPRSSPARSRAQRGTYGGAPVCMSNVLFQRRLLELAMNITLTIESARRRRRGHPR